MCKKNFLLVLLLLVSAFVKADPTSDLIKRAGTAKEYPKDSRLVIFDSVRVEVQETGLSHFYTHTLTKVLTAKGALDLSVIKYDYDPLSALAEIRKVKIYRATGQVEDLDVTRVMDYAAPARAIYWGAREVMLGVGRLEPGDAVEVWLFKKGFTYALLESDDDDRFIPPMRGQFYDIVPFWSDIPVQFKYYEVQIPAGKPVFYQFYNGDVRIKRDTLGKIKHYAFSKDNILPISPEPGMVAMSDVAPKLLISTTPRWENKSTWFFGVNEDFKSFESTPEIKAKVNEILKSAKNEIDSIGLLTHWCADEIRYSGISMGKGEGFTLHTGNMTFTDRAGVCKDKAGMLITMLRAAGFKAYPAMTMAGSRIDRIVADQFNHCVTVVKMRDGKYHLLDPTWVPFLRELWSSAEQQQNYLMGVPEGADLGETPVSAAENHFFRIDGFSEILDNGTLKGGFTLTAEGQSDAAVRRIFTSSFRMQWRMLMERELLKISPLAQLVSVDFANPYDYKAGPIRLQFQYVIPNYAVVTGKEIIFTPLLAANLFKNSNGHLGFNTSMTERKFPFRDRCSRLVELSETVKLPRGCQLVYKPEIMNASGKAASYLGYISMDGDKNLKMYQKIVLNKRVYEASDWEDFRKAVSSQNIMAEEPVILKINN